MARLKSLDFEICFDTDFSSAPLSIKLNSEIINLPKGKTYLPLTVSSIDQRIDIEFSGYVPNDKKQKISVDIYYEGTKLDTVSLSTFQMRNNFYVDNVILKDYNEIYFNGILTLEFFRSWFECNILNGANLYKDVYKDNTLIYWKDIYEDKKIRATNSNVFCIGDSFTLGQGVSQTDNWPALLTLKTHRPNINLGSGGLSVDGCAINTEYVLNNYDPRTIICLLPTRLRKIYKFTFLDYVGYISIGINSDFKLPKIFKTEIENIQRNEFLDDDITKKLWIISCQNIVNSCKNKNVKCFISTWDKEMYEYIPTDVRLPFFPPLETFSERATDGSHPHKKHYELFVDSIIPYIQ
jgi:hypothetical protein